MSENRSFTPQERPFKARVASEVMPAKAVKNVGADPAQLARYLYAAMSEFQGANREAYSVEVMQQVFELLSAKAEPSRMAMLMERDDSRADAKKAEALPSEREPIVAFDTCGLCGCLIAGKNAAPQMPGSASDGSIARHAASRAKAREVPTSAVAAPSKWVVWSHEHQGYWPENRQGYVALSGAGQFTFAEALEIVRQGNYGMGSIPEETMMPAPGRSPRG